jgi:lysophospholipase
MLRSFYLSTLALTGVVYALNSSVADYAPLVNQPCPNVTTDPLLRVFTPKNQTLHPREEEYVDTRLSTVIPDAWKDWIGDGSAIGYNLSAFVDVSGGGNGNGNGNATGATGANVTTTKRFPKIGIAVSGGGYRAAQYGAGVLSALDARNDSAKAAGTGGFLQVTSYLSGLSGAFSTFSFSFSSSFALFYSKNGAWCMQRFVGVFFFFLEKRLGACC